MTDSNSPRRVASSARPLCPAEAPFPTYALVVPFYNEGARLPGVVRSLRRQLAHGATVVFVDNGSTDRSGLLVKELDEIRAGTWQYVSEPRLGKFYAMEAATRFCAERLGAELIGFLDADSTPAEAGWILTAGAIHREAGSELGFVYSPCTYRGFEGVPWLCSAYLAVDRVARSLSTELGWFANAAGSFFATDVLSRFFSGAVPTTELGLRLSLFALSAGYRGYMNPIRVWTSARRIVHDQRNLLRWSYYSREYYRGKDINRAHKIDLEQPLQIRDLPERSNRRFFHRQAVKIVCRNLIPLALYDKKDWLARDLPRVLSPDGPAQGLDYVSELLAPLERFRERPDVLTTNRFEDLLATIEANPLVTPLVEAVKQRCLREHSRVTGAANGELR